MYEGPSAIPSSSDKSDIIDTFCCCKKKEFALSGATIISQCEKRVGEAFTREAEGPSEQVSRVELIKFT